MMQKQYKVQLMQRADRMLLSHTDFLAQVSVAAARRMLKDFKEVTKQLTDNPLTFPFADELDVPGIPFETYRKCVFDKRYKAIFLAEEQDVFIDLIIDCRKENLGFF